MNDETMRRVLNAIYEGCGDNIENERILVELTRRWPEHTAMIEKRLLADNNGFYEPTQFLKGHRDDIARLGPCDD